MKSTIPFVAAVLALALLPGCGPKAETTTETKPSSSPSVEKAVKDTVNTAATEIEKTANSAAAAVKEGANTVANEAQKAVDSAKPTVDSAVKSATAAVNDAAAAASGTFDSLVQQAKGYLQEKKYNEALAVVQQLGKLQLTPEQQKTLAALKTQAQEYLSKQGVDAAAKLDSLLKK